MKPQFEHVTIPRGCSIRIFNRQIPEIPFEWHHHPECELTLTLNSRGLRFIADHIEAYNSHDLVLVPSDMPHTWASTRAIDESRPHVAIVVWFTESWASQLADICPEYVCLRKLLKRAAGALSFPSSAGEMMESRISTLLSNSARERLHTVLDLLTDLADEDAIPLATPQKAGPPITADESAQLTRILNILHEQFAEPIRVQDLCRFVNMSERSLHRLFVRHLGENLTDYLGRLRIGRACMCLVETDRPISVIASGAGFSNLSNFNRRFRSARGMSPKEFRRYYVQHGLTPELDKLDLTKRSPSLEKISRHGRPMQSELTGK
ncbi:MAG: helix-turn-helix domain-containing protein [Bryobacteraceae bacterium]